MKCEICNRRKASWLIVATNNGDHYKYHLCDHCFKVPGILVDEWGWKLTDLGRKHFAATVDKLKEKVAKKQLSLEKALEQAFMTGADLLVRKIANEEAEFMRPRRRTRQKTQVGESNGKDT